MFNKNHVKRVLAAVLAAATLVVSAGCAKEEYVTIEEGVGTEFDMVPYGSAPVSKTLVPEASGKVKLGNKKADIDASNAASGYVMVKFLQKTDARLKCIITGPSGTKYNYNLNNKNEYEVFPFSDGNGKYKIGVYKNADGNTGSKYSVSCTAEIDVKLVDEFAPFLFPNQYVNFDATSEVAKKAKELTKDSKNELESIGAVYRYVIDNFEYNDTLAATVTSGYIPDVDEILKSKKAICFDYAAVMTAMLRSQGIPCKLVIGYADDVYHAWINAYSKTEGWMSKVIYFDGKTWKLMDPTYADTAGESVEIMQYINDTTHYKAMYLY